jgi:hypothetical protein
MKPNSLALFKIVSEQKLSEVTEDVENLEPFINNFKQAILIKDFINLVGSRVKRQEEHKPNDYDLHLRLDKDKLSEYLERAIKVRLFKMVDEDLADKLHIFTGDNSGSHDSFIPLYDLALVPSDRKTVDMESKKKDDLNPDKIQKQTNSLFEINVQVLKRIPKEKGLYNYLVGIKADVEGLDKRYIIGDYFAIGHTFNTKQFYKEGDSILILVEEAWKHKCIAGIHYSIHKPKILQATEKVDGSEVLNKIVINHGTEVTHSMCDNIEFLEMDENFVSNKSIGEGKEIQVKNFPKLTQEDFNNMIGKWGEYVMQVHTRGETLHYDIRHKVNDHLQGITLFGKDINNRLKIESQRKNIRSTMKLPQPVEWLKFQGTTKIQGATKNYPGFFTIISKGKFTIHKVTDHIVRIEYKSDSGNINPNINNKAKEDGFPYIKDLPENLIDLTGNYSWTINHIGDKYLMLFNKLKD